MKTINLPSGTYAVDDVLANFEVIEKPSSNVAFVGTDIATRQLYVQFKNGSGYMYSDVDLDTLSFVPAAKSIGKFISSQVVKKFPSEKLNHSLIMPAIDQSEQLTEEQKKDSYYAVDEEPEF